MMALPDEHYARQELIEGIKKDILNIACIYPTAFDLYDEPLERLAGRIATRFEKTQQARAE